MEFLNELTTSFFLISDPSLGKSKIDKTKINIYYQHYSAIYIMTLLFLNKKDIIMIYEFHNKVYLYIYIPISIY